MLSPRVNHLAHLVVLAVFAVIGAAADSADVSALAERALADRSVHTYTFSQQRCSTLLGSNSVKSIPTVTSTKLSLTLGLPVFQYVTPTVIVTPAAATTTLTSTTTTVVASETITTDTATATQTITRTQTITQTSTSQTQLPEVTSTSTATRTSTISASPNFTPAQNIPRLQGRTVSRRRDISAAASLPRAYSGSSRRNAHDELLARASRKSKTVQFKEDTCLVDGKKTYPQSVQCQKAIEKVVVTTFTVSASKSSVTSFAPTPTSSSTTTTTKTLTSTTTSTLSATTTVTTTTTTTQTVTTTTTTTETLAGPTKTETVPGPLVTTYAACQANNYVRRVDGGWVGGISSGLRPYYASANSAEECCVQCINDATCGGFFYSSNLGECNISQRYDGTCPAGEEGVAYDNSRDYDAGLVLGSGPCGIAQFELD